MPASRQPRRAASVAMASVSGVLPEQDTATTASAAPTQPGSRSAWETTTWTGLLSPAMALSISPARPEPPMPATTMARGLPSAVKADRSVSAHDRSAVRTWAAAEATCRSMSRDRTPRSRRACRAGPRPGRTRLRPSRPGRRSRCVARPGAWPPRPAAPGCRRGPGRPGRRWCWCTPARWPPRRPAAARGIRGRPGCRAASRRSAWDSPYPVAMVGVTPDHAEHLVSQGGHGGFGVRLHVEPEQRLGVGRPQVEPPGAGG